MNRYEACVDVSHSWEDDDISVLSFIVDAPDPKSAENKLCQEISDGKHDEEIQGRKTYIWDITEDDRVE